MKTNSLISLIVVVALVVAVFFVFGLHGVNSHFCPANSSSGACGILGSLVKIVDHLFEINIFLIVVLPTIFVLGLLFVVLYLTISCIKLFPVALQEISYSFNQTLKPEEFLWIKRHINSPTA